MAGKWFDRIILMVLENHGWNQVQDLRLVKWFHENGTVFTGWHGVTHPSGPNYRALLSGNTWSDTEYEGVSRPNIAQHVSYNVVKYVGEPAERHNPFMDMNPDSYPGSVTAAKDPSLPSPAITYLGMDDQNDAHSGALAVADHHVITALEWFKNGRENSTAAAAKCLFFVTFDEAFGMDYLTNHVFAGIAGHGIEVGKMIHSHLNHYAFAQTLADNWNIDLPEMNPEGARIKGTPFYGLP